ncbi:VG15 protein [Rhodococcus sp. 5G237]
MASSAEQYAILEELTRLAGIDLQALWQLASESGDPFAFILDTFPELATQYATMTAEVSAIWYQEAAPELKYVPVVPPSVALEVYRESAAWALGSGDGVDDPRAALSKLSGSLQRHIWDADRETMIFNADAEGGARWVREAGPMACPFCKMLSTRATASGTYYSSADAAIKVVGRGKEMSLSERRARARGETRSAGRFMAGGKRTRGTRKLGESYHDNCDCRVVAVRPGREYEPPDHVLRFEEEYKEASRAASGSRAGAGNVKDIMAAWRQLEKK